MKEIKLSQGKVALVDDQDYDWLNQWRWHTAVRCNTFYAARHAMINGRRRLVYMHRLIMEPLINLMVDHRDMNGLNNQRNNLRNCTKSQNAMNKKSRGRSKYLGVTYCEGKYIYAQIKSEGHYQYIGCFKTEEDAAHAYDRAARQYHGEFANLNFK